MNVSFFNPMMQSQHVPSSRAGGSDRGDETRLWFDGTLWSTRCGAVGPFGWLKHILCVFPKIGVPQNGWFIMENPIKMHDLGGPPLFLVQHPYNSPLKKYSQLGFPSFITRSHQKHAFPTPWLNKFVCGDGFGFMPRGSFREYLRYATDIHYIYMMIYSDIVI